VHVFVVRPFGIKEGIDFEATQRDLVDPAIAAVGAAGGTTQSIIEAGNIRVDMFEQLVLADVVIADVSIHNANAYYELGIRHALRRGHTVLIRAPVDDPPFNLLTERFLQYDPADAGAYVTVLADVLRATIAADNVDSPVHRLLPDLHVDSESLMIVPAEFREATDIACRDGRRGELRLLADEAVGFLWELAGARLVARGQAKVGEIRGAIESWERIREITGQDREADRRLATLYQYAGDVHRSEQAVERSLGSHDLLPSEQAELHALAGSNRKRQWTQEWALAPDDGRQVAALRSPFLDDAVSSYGEGFAVDLNHYYSGLNALALLVVTRSLANQQPTTWGLRFDEADEAEAELRNLDRRISTLATVVDEALHQARLAALPADDERAWIELSRAELRLLTEGEPERVAAAYQRARQVAGDFNARSARRQLEMFVQLGVRTEAAQAALGVLPAASDESADGGRVLLFTGHRIDAPDRTQPRFPPEAEATAREAIRRVIEEELSIGTVRFGLAGAASGGDILFLELCQAAGLPTKIRLALPEQDYVRTSVSDAGPQWVERFRRLVESSDDVRHLHDRDQLPRWLRGRRGYDVWQRSNRWLIHQALATPEAKVTLIALWDGQAGDGPGGTANLVAMASAHGAKVVHLDTRMLFA